MTTCELEAHDARSTCAEPFDYFGAGKARFATAIRAEEDWALGTAAKAISAMIRNGLGDALPSDRC